MEEERILHPSTPKEVTQTLDDLFEEHCKYAKNLLGWDLEHKETNAEILARSVSAAMREGRSLPESIVKSAESLFPSAVTIVDESLSTVERLAMRLDKPRPTISIQLPHGPIPAVLKEAAEALRQALIHVIANCMDHGIEKPEERLKQGKREEGSITFSFTTSNSMVNLVISDDGRGIQKDALKDRASRLGIQLQLEQDSDLLETLFIDGFSTREEANEISGRGFGLGAARAAIRLAAGDLTISMSSAGKLSLTISLPLAFPIIQPSVSLQNSRTAS
jgi:signal transduction histidine kinase